MNLKKYQNKYHAQLFENLIPFWINKGFDKDNGGFYTCLDKTGNIYSTDKSVWMQGRAGYIFSFVSNAYGKNEEYLSIAKNCIDFLNKYCFDNDGRMYFTVTKDGKPLRKRRYRFSETFYIMANAEYYIATGNTECLENAKKVFDFIYGIYSGEIEDPYKITPKVCEETRSAKALGEPMILLNVTQIMLKADSENAEKYIKIIKKLIEDIKFFNKKGTNLMLESMSTDGVYQKDVASMRIINPGHTIELAWFLVQVADVLNDESIVKFAEDIFVSAFEIGWDKKYGGLLSFVDCEGLPVETYEHNMKFWWPHTETVIASLMLYKKTGKKEYLKIFEKVTKYIFKYFVDDKDGEWFGYLNRRGEPNFPESKGTTYKGPFHTLRGAGMVDLLIKDLI